MVLSEWSLKRAMKAMMQAGRELDALVAEKVMGLCPHKLKRDVAQTEFGDIFGYVCTHCGERFYGLSFHEGYSHPALLHYSTNISDAWQVVEKMLDMDNDIFIENWRDGEWCCFTMPCLSTIWPEGGRPGECADTAPLAICLAALKAVGYG